MAVDYYKLNDNQNDDELMEDEEDYIDMEVSSLTHFFPNNKTFPSPQHAQEFAFHLSSINVDKDSTPSPADELFYKGKLLPLHLPPRLQMVEKLLLDSPSSLHFNKLREAYGTPLGTMTTTTPTTGTPFESCNISPVDSGQVSRELCPEEYFREYSNGDETKGFILSRNHQRSSSWSKKIKSKIKSFFGKSGFSDESADDLQSKGQTNQTNHEATVTKKISKERLRKKNEVKEEIVCHRRSFSGAFKRRSSTTKLSSSSSSESSSSSSSTSTSSSISSNNSSSLSELLLKRSSSANSEIETSLIQGAIAHCKQSQQTDRSQKTLSEVGCHSLPSKFDEFDDQKSTTELCGG
ncbi:hypothetical protein RND81_03G106900 [Saponaria officinalis]|uniref:Membrane-associated kinase regulator 4 n=1 Tax=Saponaria officinalis TaxID=3572 RepID=A0AAW1M2P9_SAPOF